MSRKLIEVDTDAMQNDILRLEGMLADFKDKSDILVNLTADLNAMWEGSAKEAFIATIAVNTEICAEMIKEIHAITADIRIANKDYQECESAVSGLINNIM